MISSFHALFGIDHQVDDMYLPLFANDVRQAGQVTAEQQHQ